MRIARRLHLLLWLAVCGSLSCSSEGSKSSFEGERDEREIRAILDACETPQEREYMKLALTFARFLSKDEFHKAYGLCSTHLHLDMTAEQFESSEVNSRQMFGYPLRIFSGLGVNTDPIDLAGPTQQAIGETVLDARQRQMSALRAVGEIPATVPVGIRKASITLEIERDPATIPNFEEQTGLKPEEVTEEERIVSYLTVVIVDDNEQLAIGHYFHRWPDIWDQDAIANSKKPAEPHPSPATNQTTQQSVLEDDGGQSSPQSPP